MSNLKSQTHTTQVSQSEAVVQAVRETLKSEFKEGTKIILNDDQRKIVTELLIKGFNERRISLKASPANDAKLNDPKLLHAYVKGLINNWLAKSPALNGKPKKQRPSVAKPDAKASPETQPIQKADLTTAKTPAQPKK